LLLGGCATLTEQSAVSSTHPTSTGTVTPSAFTPTLTTVTPTPVPTTTSTSVPTMAPTPVSTLAPTAAPARAPAPIMKNGYAVCDPSSLTACLQSGVYCAPSTRVK